MPATILIIEDEAAIADSIIYALKTENFTALWSNTGREGLQLLKNQKIDAVILDIGLPDISGFEICKEIRKSADIPILFLTAHGSEIDRVVGFEIGADDYVVKPFSPRELTARVKAILRRRGGEAKETPAQFKIDEPGCRIAYQANWLELTRYEFRIFKILLARPEQVFSRQQLMDNAWEAPESSLDRTVDAHVKSLRAKLRAAGASPEHIHTHRGMGYSFKAAL